MNSKRDYIKNNLDVINAMVASNTPKFEMARVLNVKYQTLDKYLKEFGIQYAGNQSRKGISHTESKKSIESYFNGDIYINASKLRQRLINDGIKEPICEICGRTEWEGNPIPLELHHKNFNHYDNRLENLQILCSNCHSVAHNYCNTNGKNKTELNDKLFKIIRNKHKSNTPIRYCKHCGKELTNKQKNYCSQKCSHEHMSKIPQKEELQNVLTQNKWNKTAVGKYYGVSDKTIQKWISKYGLHN